MVMKPQLLHFYHNKIMINDELTTVTDSETQVCLNVGKLDSSTEEEQSFSTTPVFELKWKKKKIKVFHSKCWAEI